MNSTPSLRSHATSPFLSNLSRFSFTSARVAAAAAAALTPQIFSPLPRSRSGRLCCSCAWSPPSLLLPRVVVAASPPTSAYNRLSASSSSSQKTASSAAVPCSLSLPGRPRRSSSGRAGPRRRRCWQERERRHGRLPPAFVSPSISTREEEIYRWPRTPGAPVWFISCSHALLFLPILWKLCYDHISSSTLYMFVRIHEVARIKKITTPILLY